MWLNRESTETMVTICHRLGKSERYKLAVLFRYQNKVYRRDLVRVNHIVCVVDESNRQLNVHQHKNRCIVTINSIRSIHRRSKIETNWERCAHNEQFLRRTEQGNNSQGWTSVASPTQLRLKAAVFPFECKHNRDRMRIPGPHSALHSLQNPHGDQWNDSYLEDWDDWR